MDPLLKPEDVRAHGLESDLADPALQLLIDAAEAEIVERFGPHDSATEDFVGTSDLILLRRKATAITSVTEFDADNDPLVLNADDYALTNGGWTVLRLATGPNPASYFDRRVQIVYTPVDDSAKRKGVLIQLVKLAAAYSGYKRAQDPDGSITEHDYTAERSKILGQLSKGPVIV